MLKVENLNKRFGSFDAVKDLSFSVEPGEVLGVIGPNGAGKTTILRCIAGILNFRSGKIEIAGKDIRKYPIEGKQVFAYLPDAPSFFETLTLWEHIEFVSHLYKVQSFQDKAMELLSIFELSEKKDQFTGQLSRGQRQMLGIICAFVHSPKLMILDEPMTALDPKRIYTLIELIKRTAKSGSAILVSSHLLSILEQTSTKLLIMEEGACKFYGTAEQVAQTLKSNQKDPHLEDLFFRATDLK